MNDKATLAKIVDASAFPATTKQMLRRQLNTLHTEEELRLLSTAIDTLGSFARFNNNNGDYRQ